MSFDKLFENATRRVGNRITRRSFMGRMALATSAVGVGGLAVKPSPQVSNCGHPCSNTGCDSTTCGCTTCHGCPSGTCAGGAWYMCTSICNTGYYTRYLDCLTSSTCRTYCGCDGRPGCYFSTPYGSCSGHSKVYCRSITCLGPAPCSGNFLCNPCCSERV
jgi:hypothetical protein